MPAQEPQLRIEAEMHSAQIYSFDISADQRLMVTGSADKTVRLWALPEGKLIRVLRVPIGPGIEGLVVGVAISPDGKWVATGSWIGSDESNTSGQKTDTGQYVQVYEATTGLLVRRLGPLPHVIRDLRFDHSGQQLAVGMVVSPGRESGIAVWNTSNWTLAYRDHAYEENVRGLSFDKRGRLAVASEDGNIRLYRRDGTLHAKKAIPGLPYPYSVAFSPDGTSIAVGNYRSMKIGVVAADTLRLLHAPKTEDIEADNAPSDLSEVTWSADGRYLYAAGRVFHGGYTRLYRWDEGGRGTRTQLPNGPTNSIYQLRPWGASGVAYVAGDVSFGMYGDDARLAIFRRANQFSFAHSAQGDFLISPDASRLWVLPGLKGDKPWLFDLARLDFANNREQSADLIPPRTDGIDVTDWRATRAPKVGGTRLKLDADEIAFSLAIAPDKTTFVIGAEFTLRRYDASGKMLWRRRTPGATWHVNLSANGAIVVAAYSDGTLRWHRSSDGQELLALFVPATGRRWVVWTPKGYYAASPGGESLIGWHVNRTWDEAPDFFPAHRFRAQFYRPDVVALLLETLDEDQAIKQANEAARIKVSEEDVRKLAPPVVTILDPIDGAAVKSRAVQLTYSVRAPGGAKLDAIEVRIDGVLQHARGAAQLLDEDEKTRRIAIQIPQHDVTVSVIAKAGKRISVPARVELKWVGPKDAGARKPRLFALIVGVSDYARDHLDLGWAAKDANDIAKALTAQKGHAYSDVEVLLLRDGEAKTRSILRGLSWLRKSAGERDVAMLFLAGHGMSEGQEFYFLSHDADPNELLADAVSGSMLRTALRSMKTRVVMFMDVCHGGQGLETSTDPPLGPVDMHGLVNTLTDPQYGVVMFAASKGREFSYEHEAWRNGAFTEALLQALNGNGADFDGNGRLDTWELNGYLTKQVPQLVASVQKGPQTPVMRKSAAIPEFTLAYAEQLRR